MVMDFFSYVMRKGMGMFSDVTVTLYGYIFVVLLIHVQLDRVSHLCSLSYEMSAET